MVLSARGPSFRRHLREDRPEFEPAIAPAPGRLYRRRKNPDGGRATYSHVLPSPQAKTLRGRRIAGENWAMAGDAAACVDPITGEGLFYALRSGDLLAQASD